MKTPTDKSACSGEIALTVVKSARTRWNHNPERDLAGGGRRRTCGESRLSVRCANLCGSRSAVEAVLARVQAYREIKNQIEQARR